MSERRRDRGTGAGRGEPLFPSAPWTARSPGDQDPTAGPDPDVAGAGPTDRADRDLPGERAQPDAPRGSAQGDVPTPPSGTTPPPGPLQPPAPPGPPPSASASTPTPGRPRASTSSSSGSFLRELPLLLVIALVLAFLLRTFVVQVFYIPSSSMEPTLAINDRMIVEKITYRFREPARGEIVVFEGESLTDTTADDNAGERFVRVVGQFLGVVPASARDFVKRVIGLPGDEILIQEGVVSVNGVPLDEPYVVFDDPSDYGPVVVPEGTLFFLGDNRPNSSDSRRSLGFVPRDKVVGRAYAIIWPFDHAGLLTGVEYDLDASAPPIDPGAASALPSGTAAADHPPLVGVG